MINNLKSTNILISDLSLNKNHFFFVLKDKKFFLLFILFVYFFAFKTEAYMQYIWVKSSKYFFWPLGQRGGDFYIMINQI